LLQDNEVGRTVFSSLLNVPVIENFTVFIERKKYFVFFFYEKNIGSHVYNSHNTAYLLRDFIL